MGVIVCQRKDTMNKTCIIGDIHGHYTAQVAVLLQADLITEELDWCGGDTTLWFMGDFFDRGPEGIAVLELVMRLQAQAGHDGGRVQALIGNHEIQLLAAHHFRHRASTGPGKTFLADWQRNGGQPNDLARLNLRHIEWLSQLPVMTLEDDRLFIHADALLYPEYGDTIEAVNSAFGELLHGEDTEAWDQALARFSEHGTFHQRGEGVIRAVNFLDQFGGRQIVHGHTPIMSLNFQPPASVTEPLIYADGLCINVDGGIYRGGPGFVYELPPIYELTPVI